MARRRRERTGGDATTVIYWRDIPAQVTATVAGRTEKVMLEPRFQHAIDRAATVAGLTETDAYVAQWRRVTESLDAGSATADPSELVARLAADLAAGHPRDRLEALVTRGGVEAGTGDECQHPPDTDHSPMET